MPDVTKSSIFLLSEVVDRATPLLRLRPVPINRRDWYPWCRNNIPKEPKRGRSEREDRLIDGNDQGDDAIDIRRRELALRDQRRQRNQIAHAEAKQDAPDNQ